MKNHEIQLAFRILKKAAILVSIVVSIPACQNIKKKKTKQTSLPHFRATHFATTALSHLAKIIYGVRQCKKLGGGGKSQ